MDLTTAIAQTCHKAGVHGGDIDLARTRLEHRQLDPVLANRWRLRCGFSGREQMYTGNELDDLVVHCA